jgi:hypothetical protein
MSPRPLEGGRTRAPRGSGGLKAYMSRVACEISILSTQKHRYTKEVVQRLKAKGSTTQGTFEREGRLKTHFITRVCFGRL